MQQKPLRVGNVSGATGDSPNAMYRMAQDGNVNVIVGDWLSEMNIAWNAIAKAQDPSLGYEPGFLMQLGESIDLIMERKIKVVTNAGALNTESLAKEVRDMCLGKGYRDVKIAVVLGDDISELVQDSKTRRSLAHLDHRDWICEDWSLDPHCGVAYIGAWGIVEALKAGADIVLCGRVTDASPVIGAAAWWYQWSKDAWDNLAGALVAGRKLLRAESERNYNFNNSFFRSDRVWPLCHRSQFLWVQSDFTQIGRSFLPNSRDRSRRYLHHH
jgi:hypothetical protein